MRAVAGFLLVLCYLALSDAWSCREAPRLYNAQQIDAGQGKVVAVDRYRRAYFLSGTSWYRLGTYSLKHVTVGPAGLWGVDTSNRAYKYVSGNFRYARALTMMQVDAGGDGQLVGVSSSYYGYCLKEFTNLDFYGVGTLSWSSLSRRLRYYSCGPRYGCWGVDTSYRTYVTKYMTPTTCGTSGWTLVSGPRMRMIEVATNGYVFGVGTDGKVYQRAGITNTRRDGTRWVNVPMCMPILHVSYDLRSLWVVTTSGLLLQCTH